MTGKNGKAQFATAASAMLFSLCWSLPASAQDKDSPAIARAERSTLARPATPRNQASWARAIIEGYPSVAILNRQEGRVGVRATVGADGRVAACTVTRSSGYPILDAAACQGLQRYATFAPALDDNGNPTRGSWSTSIVYAMN